MNKIDEEFETRLNCTLPKIGLKHSLFNDMNEEHIRKLVRDTYKSLNDEDIKKLDH